MELLRTMPAASLSGDHIGAVIRLQVEPNVIVQDLLEGVSHDHGPQPNVLLRFEKVRPNRQDSGYVGSGSFQVDRDVRVEVVMAPPIEADLKALREALGPPAA